MRDQADNRRRPGLLWVGAAIAVVSIVLGAVVVARDDNPAGENVAVSTSSVQAPTSSTTRPTTAPSTSAPSTSAPSTSAPSTTPSSTTVLDPWDEIPGFFFSGPAGDYRTTSGFFAQFKVTLPDGWARAFPELPDIIELSPTPQLCEADQFVAACAGLITVTDTAQADVEATVDFLGSRDGIVTSEPVPAVLGGAEGVRVDLTTDQQSATVSELADGGRIVMSADRTIQAYALDVAGVPVTVYVDFPTGTDFVEQAQPILDTVTWRALGG